MDGHYFRRIECSTCFKAIDVPIWCGDRFCPICSITRSIRVKRRLEFLVEHSLRPKGMRWKFITLTIRSESDLPAMIRHLIHSFQRLRNRQIWKDRVDGGAYTIEITGHPGAWHAHIHAIVIADWIAWEKLMPAWKRVSGGRGVFIQEIPAGVAVNYITKYLSKPNASEAVCTEISASLKGVRLFAPFGSWFNVNKLFRRKPAACRHCAGTKWHDYDIWRGSFPSRRWKTSEEINSPPPAPS